ncbi:MAG: hypothetical protein LBL87_02375 [Ruminococcus sp.]|jgi:hypothetical protein|nr:hypothetical protein [Ruminococcus sp.]
MRSNFLGRFGLRLIIFAVVMVVGFFVAGFEMLKVSGRYEDFYDLESTDLKDGAHYGGAVYYVYYNYAEEGYENEYSGEVTNAYEQYYLAEIYIEALDEWKFISLSLRDKADIAQADKNVNASFEEIDADPESYILWVDGLCEPLDPELAGWAKEFMVEGEFMRADENVLDYVLPYNIRQVNKQGNWTIIIIGLIIIVIGGVIISVLFAKAKKEKEDGTVNLELPPEIAEAVKNYEKKQPSNEDFFADLDKKKSGGAPDTAKQSETPPAPAVTGEMDSLAPPETAEEMPALELPSDLPEEEQPETPVGEMSADEFLNKDFLDIK